MDNGAMPEVPGTTTGTSGLRLNAKRIRNVCVVAHVDHGKTTLVDSLIASNGIISQRMSGKMRYMDSRKDEQERGITMKSSSIALCYRSERLKSDFLVNVIDSPGHVDFVGEVTSAICVSDGAVVVVDVIEGVCAQTKALIRHAWHHRLKMALVLNKLDRMILETKMAPIDAYYRLCHVLEQVNAVVAQQHAADVLGGAATSERTTTTPGGGSVYDWSSGLDEADDSQLYFAPEQRNVVFASGVDGWAFGTECFAAIHAPKLGIDASVLLPALWGDFYWSAREKRIKSGAQAKARKPLFVQLVLENVWSAYGALLSDPERAERVVSSLGLKLKLHLVRQRDPKLRLQTVMAAWLPLSECVLGLVCERLPGPDQISPERAERLLSGSEQFDLLSEDAKVLKNAIMSCDASESAPVIAHVTKMLAVERSTLGEHSEAEETELVAFARVFSGTLRHGQQLYVIERGDGESTSVHRLAALGSLYLSMGREFERLGAAPAGCVVMIASLGDQLTKSATLSSVATCPPLGGASVSTLVLRVALEPLRTGDWERLANGLRALDREDANVKVVAPPGGALELVTAGQVHLERCLHDLRTCWAPGIDFEVSTPIVPFRETVVAPSVDPTDAATPDGAAGVTISCLPIPPEVVAALEAGTVEWSNAPGAVWAQGPRPGDPNVLLRAPGVESTDLDASVVAGFRLAAGSGPLCEEPTRGVAFVVERFWQSANSPATAGQLISAVRDACRRAFQAAPQRLAAAMYECDILVTSDALGKLYAILARRCGRVLHSDLLEGTATFHVTAVLPVVESFDFVGEMRRGTSGEATPQFTFSHWEILDGDPLWVATTPEEASEHDAESTARKYVTSVRRRKGLPVHEKIVEHAEKQRTLARKK